MRKTNQRGIVIGPILFIVAILAVLAAAIAAGSGAFNGDISTVSAKAQASAILGYANEVKFAVDRLIAKGCTDTEISFENPIVSGYTNPNAPSDKSCHVFDVNGGGITYQKPLSDWPDKSLDNQIYYGHWLISSRTCIPGLGSSLGSSCWSDGIDNEHLIASLHYIHKEICFEINKMVGLQIPVDDVAPTDPGCSLVGKFTGTYSDTVALDTSWPNTFAGHVIGCYRASPGCGNIGAGYHFYQVLIVR